MAKFSLRFCLSHPAVSSVIVGIREASHAACDMAVLAQEKLTYDQLAQIAQLWDESLRFNVRTSIGELNEGERRQNIPKNFTYPL